MTRLARLRLHASLGLLPAILGVVLAYGMLVLCSAIQKAAWTAETAAQPAPATPEEIRSRVDQVLQELEEARDVCPVQHQGHRRPPPLLAPRSGR